MKHPQIILLPLLMLADYFLTVWGAVLKDKGYSSHFKTEHYELNPVWQESIRQKRWVNPRHHLLTLAASCALAAIMEFGDMPDPAAECLFGCLFVVFGMIIGRHLSNILIFRQFARRPDEVSGQLVLAHSLVLRMSTVQNLAVVLPVAIIAIFSPTPFTLGGTADAILLLALHGVWIWRHGKLSKRQAETNRAQGSGSSSAVQLASPHPPATAASRPRLKSSLIF